MILGSAPGQGVLTSDSAFLYVSDSAAGRVTPIQIASRLVQRPIPVGQCPGICRLTPGDDLLLVVNEESNDLAVIRTRTHSLLTLIPVGQHPRDLAVKVF
jgi:YVTN family beta-propeller protein